MEMKISFPGGKKVNAQWKGFTIATDQPVKEEGDNSAPSPFDLFLASIGTCAGFYALSFCQQREISLEGMEISQQLEFNRDTHMISKITLEVKLPGEFPEKYRQALVQAVSLCTVKKHLEHPPEINVTLK